VSRNQFKHQVAMTRVLVKFGSFKVLSCQFTMFRLLFWSIRIMRDMKYKFALRTYCWNSPLPYLFTIAKAVSSTVELVNSVTSDSVNSFNFVMWAFASKCYHIELVPCSDGERRTRWQTIHMIPELPVSSIPQCKLNRHEAACQELFQAIGCLEHTFIGAH